MKEIYDPDEEEDEDEEEAAEANGSDDVFDDGWTSIERYEPPSTSPNEPDFEPNQTGIRWRSADWPPSDDPTLNDLADPSGGGDATTEVYTKLDAPERVDPGDKFDVVIGLTTIAPDVDIEAIDVPFQFHFSMYVRTGLEWVVGTPEISFEVDLTREVPQRTITLRAGDIDDEIHVLYFVNGNLVGSALHQISVERGAPGPDLKQDRGRVHFDRSADLDFVLRITEHNASVTVDVHPTGTSEPMSRTTGLGTSLRSWFDNKIKKLPTAPNDTTRVMRMRGLGRSITKLLPPAFVDDLVSFDGTPLILVLSKDPYVPWELAYLDFKDGAEAKGALLGEKAAVGRWPVDVDTPERLPPKEPVNVDELVVLTADYPANPLPHARKEAEELSSRWQVAQVDGTLENFVTLLSGARQWTCLHAALHGRNTPGASSDGLLLADAAVNDDVIRGAEPLGPLVILNACEVGGGQGGLGTWAGLPGAFISRGAQAVVAPLWAIKDDVAKDAAVLFYEICSQQGPAEAVRQLRGRFPFGQLVHGESLTWLAYQYFGHPALRIDLPTRNPE